MVLDGYVRVSQTNGRSGERFISPDVQRERIEGYARLHNHQVGRVFQELDESGARHDRPLLLEAISRQESGEAQVLCVAKLDRFGRSLVDGLAAIEQVTKAGGSFVSVADDLNFSTPTGRLVLRLMLSLAEHELDRVRATWADAQERAIGRGVHLGSLPLGYRRTQAGRLMIDESTAPLVRELFARRLRGETPTQLARWLTQRGVPTYRGGCRWSGTTVKVLIGRRVYLGETSYGTLVNRSAHPALVEPDVFQKAQVLEGGGPGPRHTRPALLTGLLRCANCSRLMSTRTDHRGRRIYQCQGSSSAGQCPGPVSVTDSIAEPYVEAVAWGLLKHQGLRSQRVAITRAEKQVAASAEQLERYRDHPTLPRTLGADRYAAGLAVRVTREEEALVALADARQQAELRPAGLKETQAAWPTMSIPDRRRMLGHVLDCVFVFPAREDDRLWAIPKGDQPEGLPSPAPRKMTAPKSFDPTPDQQRALPAPGTLDWSEAKVTHHLRAFLRDREAWPKFEAFQAAGCGLAHANGVRLSPANVWARRFGLRPPNPKLPMAGWNEQRVRAELAVASVGWTDWPTQPEFVRLGLGQLRAAIRLHRGAHYWSQEMGLTMQPRQQRSRQRWTEQQMLVSVKSLAGDQRHWPSQKQFSAAHLGGLYETVQRTGMREQLARHLGLSLEARGQIYYRPPTRWDEVATRKALDFLLAGADHYPTMVEWKAQGLGGLYQRIGRQPGGHTAVAEHYGLQRAFCPRRASG